MGESVHSGVMDLVNSVADEEFRSCFGEDEDWQDADDSLSQGEVEANEEVPLKVCEDYREEGDGSALIISEVLKENSELSLRTLVEHGEDADELKTFFDEPEETLSEGSHKLFEGIDQYVTPECSFNPSKGLDGNVFKCSLRMFEETEEIISVCSLILSEDDAADVSECSIRLSEGEEEISLNCTLRLCEGQEDDMLDSSLRLGVRHEEDVLECSLRLSENDEDVSECSLVLFEDHTNDISECRVSLYENHDKDEDEFFVRIFSKGVSVSMNNDLGTKVSGIGVVLEKPQGVPFLQVQKKLDFFVEELIAEHLALMNGLLEALRNDFRKVLAFTDSDEVYRMITSSDTIEDQLLIALQERIHELADKFESFVLRMAPRYELKRPLLLAQVATGTLSELIECYNCGEEKHQSKMIEMDCSHDLCSDCMSFYVESKVQNSRIPVKCPHERCTYYISNTLYRSFLPSTSFGLLEGAVTEAEAQNFWRFYCPFPDCSNLLRTHRCFLSGQALLIQSNKYCIECPDCCRLVCSRCQVPWHSSLRCEEYQSLPLEDRDIDDISLHQLAQVSSWKRCQQCRRMIEHTEGCYHVTCWCGHEFCFSCGSEYRFGTQTCRCEILDENSESSSAPSEHETELWRWDCFNLLPGSSDDYTEQEKNQLALIQRFLAGGISLDNHNSYQSPPRSSNTYLDTIKDLNQLPWLESFISVIGDTYQEDHTY